MEIILTSKLEVKNIDKAQMRETSVELTLNLNGVEVAPLLVPFLISNCTEILVCDKSTPLEPSACVILSNKLWNTS